MVLPLAVGLAMITAPAGMAVAAEAGGCIQCDLRTDPAGTRGRMIVVSDDHRGLRPVAGTRDCIGCAWKVIPECTYHAGKDGQRAPGACGEPTRAPITCKTPSGQPGVPYRTFFAPHGTDFRQTGGTCLGDKAKPVSLDAVLAQLRVYIDHLIPAAPKLEFEPSRVTIVQLPTLMRTETQPVAAKSFFADAGAPVSVQVSVRPFAWHWKVDGAAVLTTDFPGRAYDEAHSPRREPDFYASHTFEQTGNHRLSVTVDWAATAIIPGLGQSDVAGVTPRTSASVPVQVQQARAQLESGAQS